jgi:site-specific recombinase XerC
MTYAAHHGEFSRYAGCGGAPVAPQAGVLRRILDAFVESRQRQADKDMARFIVRSGGRLTDDIERRMMNRLTSSGWNARD